MLVPSLPASVPWVVNLNRYVSCGGKTTAVCFYFNCPPIRKPEVTFDMTACFVYEALTEQKYGKPFLSKKLFCWRIVINGFAHDRDSFLFLKMVILL